MEDKLYHYGILGMRWGQRKSRGGDDDDLGSGRKRIGELTNAELKERIDRALLEKQYRDVTKKELTGSQKFLSDVLATSGKQVASVYAAKYMTAGVEFLIKTATAPKP